MLPKLYLNKKRNVCTVVPHYLQYHFLWFQLPVINHGPKIFNGKFQK